MEKVNKARSLRRQRSMKTVMGDILRSKSTGELYKVKKIKMQTVLLEAESIPNKVWLGNKDCLEVLYDKVENQKNKKSILQFDH
jgi:hypothetical protein